MRVPRDLDGDSLVRRLRRLGYVKTRQRSSHVRLTLPPDPAAGRAERHLTVPLHDPIRVGTLSGILGDVADQLDMSKDDVVRTIS